METGTTEYSEACKTFSDTPKISVMTPRQQSAYDFLKREGWIK